jgi:hypothetical protein
MPSGVTLKADELKQPEGKESDELQLWDNPQVQYDPNKGCIVIGGVSVEES